MGWIATIIVGAIAGFLASKFVYNSGQGFLTNLIIGVIGAVVGNSIFHFFGLAGTDGRSWIGSIFVATIGAIVVLWIYNAIVGRRV